MKRFFALLLALVVVLSVSSVAFAADVSSVTAPPVVEDGNKAAALPTLVESDEGVVLTPVDNVEDLPEDAQEEFKQAEATVKEAIPEGMVARYLVYAQSPNGEPYKLTLKLDDVKDIKDFAARLFKDGKWIELEVIMNDDGTFTVVVPSDGTLAICTAK